MLGLGLGAAIVYWGTRHGRWGYLEAAAVVYFPSTLVSSYLGLAFVAVGLAVSAATSNPLVAAVGSLAVLLALWGAGIVSGGLTGWPRLALEELAPSGHVVLEVNVGRPSSRNHLDQIWACDFLTVETLGYRTLYVYFVVELGTRRVLHWAVTAFPTGSAARKGRITSGSSTW